MKADGGTSEAPVSAEATASESAASPRLGYLPGIQGIRALAVIAVVLYHADVAFPGGYVGVDLFFVISGFVIGRLLLNELDTTGTVRLRNFFARRVRRLLPALATAVVVTMILSGFLSDPLSVQRTMAFTAIAAAGLSSNIYLMEGTGGYFDAESEKNPLLHLWSLSVEEQFYLVLPFVLFGVWRFVASRKLNERVSIDIILIVGILGSFGAGLFLAFGPGTGGRAASVAYFATPIRAWEFLAGVLLASWWLFRRSTLSRSLTYVLGVIGMIFFVVSCLLYDDATAFPGVAAVLPVAAGVMLVMSTTSGQTHEVSKFLSLKPMVWIGDRSYGWYLWHWPLIVFFDTWIDIPAAGLIGALVGLFVADLSYRFIEDPFRRMQSMRGLLLVVVGVLMSLAMLLVGFAVRWVAQNGWASEVAVELGTSETLAIQNGCHEGAFSVDSCVFTTENSRGEVLLLGDSHASALSDGAKTAVNAAGYDLSVFVRLGCSVVAPRADKPSCDPYRERALEIALERADVVVFAQRSASYVNPDEVVLADANGASITTSAQALDAWADGIRDFVTELDQAGIGAVWLYQVPEFDDEGAKPLAYVNREPEFDPIDLDEVEALRGPVVAAEQAVLEQFDQIATIDPVPSLCPTGTCRSFDGERHLYSDENHLNIYGSALLVDEIEAALTSAAR